MKKKLKVNNDESGSRKYRFVLPNKGDNQAHTLRSRKKYLRKLLSKKSTLEITYTREKLSSQFNIKKTNFEHQHDMIHHANCP